MRKLLKVDFQWNQAIETSQKASISLFLIGSQHTTQADRKIHWSCGKNEQMISYT
jgi:hypothetical protein